ncbi:SDR family oxidoreductase [Flavimaricola marinus]|uniref:Putative ketoacyl reductase n=1 Tax=Flavimaricola marinus TaxID=1819565 RepID=A0A238LIQ2_9RHOB|nr:SDR family oxidoreductase [Flavimaricola marinus]SMY09275.1 Putative ketoacyl reductase [Flavimaricola marinus]
MEDLNGRVVIITGAAGGIGSALARALSDKGARLVLLDRTAEALAALEADLDTETLSITCDVASEAEMDAMAAATLDRFGQIDALVTTAAILRAGDGMRTLAQTSYAEWRQIIDVNLTGTFLANRAVLPAMQAAKRGDIINLSSTSGRQGRAFDGPYSASKAGIIGLSESLSEEVAREGIRVQTLLPDAVDTGLWGQAGGSALKPRHMLTPDRVAEVIVYLLSLPRDTYLLNSIVVPAPTRRRKG